MLFCQIDDVVCCVPHSRHLRQVLGGALDVRGSGLALQDSGRGGKPAAAELACDGPGDSSQHILSHGDLAAYLGGLGSDRRFEIAENLGQVVFFGLGHLCGLHWGWLGRGLLFGGHDSVENLGAAPARFGGHAVAGGYFHSLGAGGGEDVQLCPGRKSARSRSRGRNRGGNRNRRTL